MPNDGGREKQPGYTDISEEAFQAFMSKHEHGATLEEIAQVMGLTRNRVAQIVSRSLVKLRTECAKRGVTIDDCPVSRESTWDRMAG